MKGLVRTALMLLAVMILSGCAEEAVDRELILRQVVQEFGDALVNEDDQAIKGLSEEGLFEPEYWFVDTIVVSYETLAEEIGTDEANVSLRIFYKEIPLNHKDYIDLIDRLYLTFNWTGSTWIISDSDSEMDPLSNPRPPQK